MLPDVTAVGNIRELVTLVGWSMAARVTLHGLLSLVQHHCDGGEKTNDQYSTTVLMIFTEWYITWECFLASILLAWCSQYACVTVYPSEVVILSAKHIALSGVICYVRAFVLPVIWERMTCGTTFGYFWMVMCNAAKYLYGHLSLVIQPGFGIWKSSNYLYATTVFEVFTEWRIMLAIALGSLFHAGFSGWDCIIVYPYVVAILYTIMRVTGVTALNHSTVHGTIGFPMLVKFHPVFSLVYSCFQSCKQWLMETLNFLSGLRL